MLIPNPARWPRLDTQSDAVYHRFHNCQFYDYCLDAVCEMDWSSWTCRACPIFYRDYFMPPPNEKEIKHILQNTTYSRFNKRDDRHGENIATKALDILEKGGNISTCAKILNCTRNTVRNMLRQHAKYYTRGDELLSVFILHTLDVWDNFKGLGGMSATIREERMKANEIVKSAAMPELWFSRVSSVS